jgi:hypothetical protein
MTRANKAKLFDPAIEFVESTRSKAQPLEVGAIANPPKQVKINNNNNQRK